jgi:hypothetical protein
VGHAGESDDVAGRAARPVRGGIVPRIGLLERLGASARVTVLSASPGSGKTVLLRTSVLERVSGPLADALTEGSGGEQVL